MATSREPSLTRDIILSLTTCFIAILNGAYMACVLALYLAVENISLKESIVIAKFIFDAKLFIVATSVSIIITFRIVFIDFLGKKEQKKEQETLLREKLLRDNKLTKEDKIERALRGSNRKMG